MPESIHIERSDRHAVLTLDRPPLNILDLETLARLDRAIGELADSPPLLLRVRSAIPGTFSAGVSIQDHTADKIETMLGTFHGALAKLRALPAITVAEVRGRCLGGGMELALACDLVLASASATFAQPEIALGCFPPYAAALYPRRIGSDRALLLLATGETLDGDAAERWGLATECVADDDFVERADALAANLLSRSAHVLALTKRAVRAGAVRSFAAALSESERLYRDELGASDDLREGIEAFLAERSPRWTHR